MTQIGNVFKFILLLFANLLSDLAQVEKLLPSIALVVSLIAGLAPATSPVGRIAAAIIGGLAILGLAIPAIIANGSQLLSDFELLWGKATGQAPIVPIPLPVPVLTPPATVNTTIPGGSVAA